MQGNKEYCGLEDYGLVGDMHTCALVSKNGSIDSMCWPVFDSPSIFCRILDKAKGGHFSITPSRGLHNPLSKQRYRPYTNMLETRWIHDEGVINILDYFPVTKPKSSPNLPGEPHHACHSGLIRKAECVRGEMDIEIEVFPAFNYARDSHTAQLSRGDGVHRAHFQSAAQRLQVSLLVDAGELAADAQLNPELQLSERPGHLGPGLVGKVTLKEGQSITLLLHDQESITSNALVLGPELRRLERTTGDFWSDWTSKCTFRGHYREQVERSLLVLKLLTYKPTGAIVAAPTFSLPEHIGGTRNWDYRYSWVRDAAFTVYVFLKNGYPEEAESYINFIFDRIFPPLSQNAKPGDPFLPIMVTIHGEREIPEMELDHLEGYRGSRPVRIGNGAATHIQLDIYGELMDSIYLYNKHAADISYDHWLAIRRMVDFVIEVRHQPDQSIWEVRGPPQNFVYSKIMLWVALDRGIRLAEKRSNLPCPARARWVQERDDLYDEIMTKGYNAEKGFFCMSYENRDALDAAVLIAPLVFFVAPNDPRLLSTIQKIMEPPARGGLSVASMVSRYDTGKIDDVGVGGNEGAFLMVTFWLVEAMMRQLRRTATSQFDSILSFANHLGMFSEEVASSGEQIGNMPQAFSHLACVSAAMNLGGGEK
ncbi:glycoside hydrolase family 15 protein [Aspergillus aculeatus ATCC 16872]|uniref:Glycoside hydrolase family 15 protein n=1 Tax=Aspergillus aculeatus (strain ATCC 16872 / CBS 172.66 / WB 5094) TaxID=690307 RepID=A0A1L9WTQ6_ASPA1|nr:glycoside hydrolase family 15 protein [Aspergillus aculeatus ATCC 16872]OJJ99561.1 glycoside hydrolase family 15 protein [Aspergillus aculeatus ATCC 16872]